MVVALALCLVALVSVLPATAQASGTVYVTNDTSAITGAAPASVSQFGIGPGGVLSPLSPARVAAGGFPFAVALSPDGKSAYVANLNGGKISQYDIDPATGGLSPKTPATVDAGSNPSGVAVTPDGKNAYVSNVSGGGPGSVSQYTIDPVTGGLSPKSPATVSAGISPDSVAVAPDGKSAYVTNGDLPPSIGSVLQYDIEPLTGKLSPKNPATVDAGLEPVNVAVTPDGESAYVTNSNGGGPGSVSQYTIDPVTGRLSPKTPASVATVGPESVAVSPDGRSAYVTNVIGTVSQYDIGPISGALSPKTPPTVAAGIEPVGVAVTPDGKSAYVTNFTNQTPDGTVSQYDIDPSSGALSPKSPASVPAGTSPTGIAVGLLPAQALPRSTATRVGCAPSVFAPGDATVCRATVTDTGAGSTTTPTGTVSFTNTGAGRFFGSPCGLSGSGPSASCAVFFTSFPRGGQGITASYSGDTTHSPSTGTTMVLVAVPASTEGCVVFGHGRITAANGDPASFRGLAAATPPRGAEFYRDNGPANPMRVRSSSVDAVTCNADATRASIFGKASINGASSVEYRIDIQLAADKGGKDSYRIRLSTGYDSGAQPIRHGDVDIRLRNSEHGHHDNDAEQGRTGDNQDGG